MKFLTKTLTAFFTALPLTAVAEPLPKPVADMECMVGTWKGAGSFVAGKDSSKINATWACKRTSSKFGVSCSFQVTGIPGVPVYDEADLMGYEPNTNTYHWYSVTNAGETHDHVARIPDGNKIEFTYNGMQEGKAYREVILLEFSNDSKSINGKCETFLAGASTSVMQLSLRK